MSGLQTSLKRILLLTWLGSLAWLIRYEAFPHWFEETVQGYRMLLRDLPAVQDSWMKIYAGDQHVGYTNSTLELAEVDGREDWVLKSQVQLMVAMPDVLAPLRVSSAVHLHNQHQLTRFEVQVYFQRLQGYVTGQRFEGDTFDVSLSAGNVQMQRRVTLPPDVILISPFGETALRSLRDGQQMRMRTFDPLSLSGDTREMILRGGPSEEVTLRDGSRHEARTLTVSSGDMTVRVWADAQGLVLKQETPFGLTLEMSEVGEAIRIPEGQGLNPMGFLETDSFFPLQKL